jgi:hypothetical protein
MVRTERTRSLPGGGGPDGPRRWGAPGRVTRPTEWPLRLRRRSEGGLEFFEAGSADCSTEQVLERGLAADGVDPLAQGVGHLAEPSLEDVENCLCGPFRRLRFSALEPTC